MNPINLSPSHNRIGRACVCVLHEGLMLMVSYADFFTFPGGGINPSEDFTEAAWREAWEEAGARVKIERFLFEYQTNSDLRCECYLASLESIEPSSEQRLVHWVDPLRLPWCEDKQIKLANQALGFKPIDEMRAIYALES